MPRHVCIDPHDPYAQREVQVEFERLGSGVRLIAAIDDGGDDILPDLDDAQRDDLLREISDADRLGADRLAGDHHAADGIRASFSGAGARAAAPC